MAAIDLALARLKVDEGFRAAAYQDTTGHTTIGYGFNVGAGISEFAAAALLQAQAQELAQSLSTYTWFQGLDDERASVFIELAFNLGLNGLLGFPSMLHYAALRDWPNAAAQLLDSIAAQQDPSRYEALAAILQSGNE